MAEVWSLYGTISLRGFDVATRQLRELESQAKQAGSVMASKLETLAISAKAAADKLSMLLLPVSTLGGAALKTAVDFEAAMRDVKAVMGATEADMREMWEAAKRMGPELGYAPLKVAEGFRILATSGVKAKEAIAALPGVLELARATGYDLGLTAEAVLGTIRMFGMAAEDTSRVADVFVNAISNSMAEMNKLAYSLRYAGPVAASVGWDLEHLVAVLGQLYNAGFQGEQAGTILRAALSRLLDPTRDVVDALKSVGLTIDDLNPRTKTMTDILAALERAHVGAADAVRIFGREAGPGMLALLASGSRALADLESKIRATGIAAGDVAREQLKSLSGQLAQLRSELEALAIELAEEKLDRLAEAVGGLRERVHGLSPATKSLIGDFLALLGAGTGAAVAYKGLSWVFKTLAEAVGTTATGVNSLGALLLGTGAATRMMTNEFGMASAATRVLYKETLGLAAGYTALLALLGQIPSLVARGTEAVSRQVRVGLEAEQLREEKLETVRQRVEARRAEFLAEFEQAWRRQQILREAEEEDRRRQVADEAERSAREAEERQRRAVSDMVSAIRSAMAEVASVAGQGSAVARQRLASALEEAAFYARRAGAPLLAASIEDAMELVGAVVSDGSGEAARALLERLRYASERAVRYVKEDADVAAFELKTAYASASAEVADRFDEIGRRVREALAKASEEARSRIRESVDWLHDSLVSALRKRIEAQRDAEIKAVEDSVERERERVERVLEELDREYQARKRNIEQATEAEIGALKARIEAIDEEARREELAAQEARELARIRELEVQIQEAESFEERQRLQIELQGALVDRERRLRNLRREEEKAALQARIDELEKQTREEIEELEEKQRAEEERLRKGLEAFVREREERVRYLREEHYPKMLEEAALAAEAEKLIIAGKHAEILKVLREYGEGWRTLGITFGQRLLEGIGPYIEELSSRVWGVLSLAGGVKKTAAGRATGYSAEDLEIISAKIAWHSAEEELQKLKAAGTLTPGKEAELRAVQAEAHARAEEARRRGGTIPETVSLRDLGIELPRMHSGGLVEDAVSPVLRRLFDLLPGEVPVVLERGEVVVPAGSPALTGVTQININLHNCVFQDGTDAGQRMGAAIVSELRRLGVMRY